MPNNPFETYLKDLNAKLASGETSEHTFRTPLENFIKSFEQNLEVINEPKRIKCGVPDLKILRKKRARNITIGYIEAKDIGADLRQVLKTDQLKRYLEALPNLILTDYVNFIWFVDGQLRKKAELGDFDSIRQRVKINKAQEQDFTELIEGYLAQPPVSIDKPQDLARRMALITKMIREVIIKAFEKGEASSTLRSWRKALAEALIPDLDKPEEVEQFADLFSQTLAYGLFAARVEDITPMDFNLQEAQKLIPKTNPFLRKFFYEITGPDMEYEPFYGYVEDLVELLSETRMDQVLKAFGTRKRSRDPVLHFYETFLAAYDPKERERRGVYYTPDAVVSYIVRSVDKILKTKFHCPEGLADKSETKYTLKIGDRPIAREVEHKCHRVLILDPACGTGTFLYHTIDLIREGFIKRRQSGMWPGYVRDHLLTRIFGLELLMAPYAVAHFKLGMQLAARDMTESKRPHWAYDFKDSKRLGVYLTNTLEEVKQVQQYLDPAMKILTNESNAAIEIKHDLPIMVIIGNPPYSGHSANKGEWIANLVEDYKRGFPDLYKPAQAKWLQNDYVKFIRFGQWRINNTGSGILSFITDHGYLNNPTFKGMRKSLVDNFSEIYFLDLHGSLKKKEKCPDGSKDENIFDIQQGVTIGVFIKKLDKEGQARVFTADLWGKRGKKYDWLLSHDISNTSWSEIKPKPPFYLFKPQNEELSEEYNKNYKITEIMNQTGDPAPGIVTTHDSFAISFTKEESKNKIERFIATNSEDEARRLFRLCSQSQWNYNNAKKELCKLREELTEHIFQILYRPFDLRYTVYNPHVAVHRRDRVMRHMMKLKNLGLCTIRNTEIAGNFEHVFCTRNLIQHHTVSLKEVNYLFPLYMYKEPTNELNAQNNLELEYDELKNRYPNLNPDFIKELEQKLKITFIQDGTGDLKQNLGPEDIFNYIYAVFHAPTYRTRYSEFLKIDFPRVPVTSNLKLFRELASKGGELVKLHLLDSTLLKNTGVGYPVRRKEEENLIEKGFPEFIAPGEPEPGTGKPLKKGRVYINALDKTRGLQAQYFEGVEPEVWEFQIGGYQVCEKWLKDRRGRKLEYDEQDTYCKIVKAIRETIRLMSEIDRVIDKHGGWPIK